MKTITNAEIKKRKNRHHSLAGYSRELGRTGRLRVYVAALIICLAVIVTGCSTNDEDGDEYVPSPDTVFSVNGEEISNGEWNLYAVPEMQKAEKLYGEDIWQYRVNEDGKLFSEVMREEIRKKIASVKIVAGRAAEMGISLSEDDQLEISIQTADYMEKLTPDEKSRYEITEETVKKVYSDNLLASKVYEHLTLNVDTSASEEEVRHMQLQYVTVSKSYEDEEGNTVHYSDSEVIEIRNRLSKFVEKAHSGEYATLGEVPSEEFTVTDIVAGLDDLKERFPEELAGTAFWLRANEITDIFETGEAFFVFDCVKLRDNEATDKATIELIESREKEVFDEKYAEWAKEAVIK